MPPTVHIRGLDGLRVVPPSHPDFDVLAAPLLGRVSEIVLKLKPMLILVANEADDTVVSFSKTWRVTHRDGRTSRFRDHTSFPHAVCGDALRHRPDAALTPGAMRVEANGVVVHGWGNHDPFYDQFLPQFVTEKEQLLADATTLHIDVNAGIFADGTLIGPDNESWLEGLFSACIQAKQRWYRQIIAELDGGKTVDDAFGSVERVVRESSEQSRRQRLSKAFADVWIDMAASDAALWRRQYRDDDIPRLLRETIRLEPFVIRRR
jgi:hypothetical protein